MARKRSNGEHPYDTNDYEDLPDGVEIRIPVTLGDRIHAVCQDSHHCTIATAITRTADTTGIVTLGRRGVSRTLVAMRLDPEVYPWAMKTKWYKGKLTRASASLALELDVSPLIASQEKATLRMLKDLAKVSPDGENTIYTEIVITSPPPSQKKGYRKGASVRGRTGSGTKTDKAIPRREWQAAPLPMPKKEKPAA